MSKLILPEIKQNIILERAEQSKCPICNKEFTKEEINKLKDVSYIIYQNKSHSITVDITEVLVHNKHIKEK